MDARNALRSTLASAAVLTLLLVIPAQADFVDVTTPPIDDPGPSAFGAWFDYEGDGDLDLYVSNHNEIDKVYRNDGDDLFVDVTAYPFGSPEGVATLAFGDMDGDGDLDAYLPTHGPFGGGQNWLLRNDGNGNYVDVTVAAGLPTHVPEVGYTSHFLDFDQDGDLDLFVIDQNEGLRNRLYLNQGGGTFVDETIEPLDSPHAKSRPDIWGDYDDDGDLDLYLGKLNARNQLFRNNGGGEFADVTPASLADPSKTSWGEWVDFDNDGDLDLSVLNANTDPSSPGVLPNRLFRNDGGLVFTNVAGGTLFEMIGWGGGVSWGDMDNDGDLDVLVHRFFQDARLLRNDGPALDTWPDVGAGTALAAAVDSSLCTYLGDYDLDGDLDIYASRVAAHNYLFRNDLDNDNHWLKLRLVGTVSNTSAIGARIRVAAGGRTQMRELIVSAQPIHVGLGAASAIDSIVVRWPSGLVEAEIAPTWFDEQITWIEGQTVAVLSGTPLAPAVRLRQNRPNPFNPTTRIAFDLPHPGHVDLRIYDASGHIVRTLVNGSMSADTHRVTWDGRDDQGRRLSSGVYFYRLQTGERTLSRKLVMVE
jgi:hypothetical protein